MSRNIIRFAFLVACLFALLHASSAQKILEKKRFSFRSPRTPVRDFSRIFGMDSDIASEQTQSAQIQLSDADAKMPSAGKSLFGHSAIPVPGGRAGIAMLLKLLLLSEEMEQVEAAKRNAANWMRPVDSGSNTGLLDGRATLVQDSKGRLFLAIPA